MSFLAFALTFFCLFMHFLFFFSFLSLFFSFSYVLFYLFNFLSFFLSFFLSQEFSLIFWRITILHISKVKESVLILKKKRCILFIYCFLQCIWDLMNKLILGEKWFLNLFFNTPHIIKLWKELNFNMFCWSTQLLFWKKLKFCIDVNVKFGSS